MKKISLIMTVFNEADTIEKLLDSLLHQTRRPDEIIIVDGGSGDGTSEVVERWQQANPALEVVLQIEKGANISRGRNVAIAAARYEIIAATDAGVRLPANWLEHLVSPYFTENCQPDTVVCGFFRADPAAGSAFEVAMGATVLPIEQDIKPEKFLPSSRSVAFTKSAWAKIGGYPEWLDYCEDLIFDLNLKKAGFPFVWQPKAVALFRPRSNLKSFYLQYYRYARGDGKANLFLKRHLLRYFTYLVFAPVGLMLVKRFPLFGFVLFILGEGYVAKAHRRLLLNQILGWQELSTLGKLKVLAFVPIIRMAGDVAKMVGYPVGVLWRKRNKDEIQESV